MSDTILSFFKSALWEEAKGKLRAFSAMAGSYPSTDVDQSRRHDVIDNRVEKFISDFENDGLHE